MSINSSRLGFNCCQTSKINNKYSYNLSAAFRPRKPQRISTDHDTASTDESTGTLQHEVPKICDRSVSKNSNDEITHRNRFLSKIRSEGL